MTRKATYQEHLTQLKANTAVVDAVFQLIDTARVAITRHTDPRVVQDLVARTEALDALDFAQAAWARAVLPSFAADVEKQPEDVEVPKA